MHLNQNYINGRLILAGATDLSLKDMLDVAYVFLVDGINGMVNAEEVREQVDSSLADSWIDAETWGMDVAVLDSIPPAPRVSSHDGGMPPGADAS